MIEPFKWAFDAQTGTLDVWPVDGPESSAYPQHGDRLSLEQYTRMYQGRVVLEDNKIASFVIYDERPFIDRSAEGAARAVAAVKEWKDAR